MGNVYTTGHFSNSVDFDPGPGVHSISAFGSIFWPSFGSSDVYVSKLDSDGNFIWAKKMGGTGIERAYSIALDDQNNVYTTGGFTSSSADFDPGPGVFLLFPGANTHDDIFVSKLDSNGNFVWAKRLGLSISAFAKAVAIDGEGNVVLSGDYLGGDFDSGPDTTTLPIYGSHDIYVTKLDSDGNFIWAKGIGAGGIDEGFSVAVDNTGNIYFTDTFSSSADFDPGPEIFYLNNNGGRDILIVKIDAFGNFIWAKGIGGDRSDIGRSITTDNQGKIYITGEFHGDVDFDPGPGAFFLSGDGVIGSSFISVLDEDGQFVWAGKLESNFNSRGRDIVTDVYANVYSVGNFTNVTDFDPSTASNFLTSVGNSDIYIHKLRQCLFSAKIVNGPNLGLCYGDSLLLAAQLNQNIPISNYKWSTGDTTESIVLLPDSNSMYTVTITYGANCISSDTVSLTIFPTPLVTITGDLEICPGNSTFLTTDGGLDYLWNTGANSNSVILNPLSNETYSVTITDANNCTSNDSITVFLYDLPEPLISETSEICPGDSTFLSAKGGISYLWSTNDNGNTILITPFSNTIYTVTVTDANNCTASDSTTVLVYDLSNPIISGTTEICPGDSTLLSVEGGLTYFWSNDNNTNTILLSPSSDTEFSVTVTDENGCIGMSSEFVKVDESFCTPCATIPNAFTPNADGRNDVFRVLPGEDIEVLDFRIFNRWGDLVHNSVQPWDGRWQGKPQPMEVYIYAVRVESHCGVEELMGEVTLIR